ncbi:uncharacterized protein LOC122374304 [Amphibalanus amphitrite]|uniref:uncharacterized protein LOC122374304 n=1 Tax=Amphibalanus amphitrite TaxID=1232801 RepID=UPI001C90110A|nr:uncharacterized protein LOC122374304 [Amphibalanus amphitrite]
MSLLLCQLVLGLLAALAGRCWSRQLVSPPPDCITDIARRLGWQTINLKYEANYPEFNPMWWVSYLSRNSFFVHPSTFCEHCNQAQGLPPFSNGGLLFRPTPPGFLNIDRLHLIHVVGDPAWRPQDGAAGWVSWLYRDDSEHWRLVTLNWGPDTGNWVRKDVGRCGPHHFIEDRPGLLTYAIHVGDWLLRGAMRGQHLKMGFGAVPPSNEEEGVKRSVGYEDGIVLRDGQLQHGPQADIIQTMSNSLGFSFTVIPVFPKGNTSVWKELVNEVSHYRLDIGLGLMAPTPQLRERVSFLEAQWFVTTYATVRKPRLNSAGFDPGKPFGMDVWTLIVATLVISSILSWIITWLVRRFRDGHSTTPWKSLPDVSSHVLQVAGILCQRGVELTTNSYAIGTLFLTLSMFSLLIYNFYTGVMLSYMAVLVPASPFSSLSAATSNGYRVRYQAGSQQEDLLRSNSTALLRDFLAHSSPIVHFGPEEDYPAVAEAATSPNDIILASDAFLAMDESMADPAFCPLCYWPEPVAQTPVSMIATPHLHNSWMLGRYLRVLQETGVLSRWRRRLRRSYLAGSRLCSTEPQAAQYSQLGLRSVAVSFGLLLGGVLLSLLLLVAEVLVHRLTGGSSRRRQLALTGPHQTTFGSTRPGPLEAAPTPDDARRWGATNGHPDQWHQMQDEQQLLQQYSPDQWSSARGQPLAHQWQPVTSETESVTWQLTWTTTRTTASDSPEGGSGGFMTSPGSTTTGS